MKTSKKDFQSIGIFGADKRPATEVSIENLKDAGVAFVGYGMRVGETVTFPSVTNMVIKEQLTREGGSNKQYLVSVEKTTSDGKVFPTFISLGSLVRTNAETREPVSPFAGEMVELGNHEARVRHLAGKTITAKSEIDTRVPKFVQGTLIRDTNGVTQFEDGKAPVVEYVL